MGKPNLEFRKIPSLLFLYEVNADGTIFRNARSKRVKKCYKHSHNSRTEYWCLNVCLKGRIRKVYIHKVVAECWLGAKPEGYARTLQEEKLTLSNENACFRLV